MEKINEYWKFVIAAVGGVIVIGNQIVAAANDANADGSFSSNDWITVVVVAVTAIGVFAKANASPPSE